MVRTAAHPPRRGAGVTAHVASRLLWSAYTYAHARREQRLPWRDLDDVLAIQRRRVRAIVHHAYAHVPFYRDAMDARGLRPGDIRSADDLARLPLIDGRTHRQDPARFRSTSAGLGPGLCLTSSGTMGHTKEFCHDRRALLLSLAHGQRQRHVLAHFIGRGAGYRELSLLRDGAVGARIRAFYEKQLWTPRRVDLTRLALTPGELPFADEVARINAFRPDVVIGYGSYLGAFYRAMGMRGVAFHRPRVMVYGADGMPDTDRAYIETHLGIPVVSLYQSTESLRIGFQCERREGLHLSLDAVAVRLVDDAGHDVGPGEAGQVVISNLINRGTVLLNYRLGDMAVRGRTPCACGRTLPLLESLVGRTDDLIHLDDGRTMHALQLLPRLRRASDVERLQVIQEEAHAFRIHAVNDTGHDLPEAAARLRDELCAVIGVRCEVAVVWVESLPPESNGKTRVVISRVMPPSVGRLP
jgi:phenylacetate-CoA ligase